MSWRRVDDFGAEVKRVGGYAIVALMPYWVGGETWTLEDQAPVSFAFVGSKCHGISNHDDGNILWDDEGFDDPDLAWTSFVRTYSQEDSQSPLEELVATCEKEFGVTGICADEPDEEAVMSGLDGPSPITFGMIRRARRSLVERSIE